MSDSISLPSLLLAGLLSFLALRYILPRFTSSSSSSSSSSTSPHSSSSSTSPNSSSSSSIRTRPVDLTRVEQVAQMFPQLDRRSIAWDLARNGGNIGATTERVLGGRGLEVPPVGYAPPGLGSGVGVGEGAGEGAKKSGVGAKKVDLIERYGLRGRVEGGGEGDGEGVGVGEGERQEGMGMGKGKGKAAGWASTKNERAALLAKRRDDMILQARRRMVEREKGKGRAVD